MDRNSHQWNRRSGSSKNQLQMTGAECEMAGDVASAKMHTRSFSDLAQWLQNGEDVAVANYIDRRVVESVLKCRQLGKQCPQKKSTSQPECQRLSHFTNTGRPGGLNSDSHEAGQQGQCRPNVADDLYQDFGGKLEAEADGDSGFSGDRNSASSTSSGLSVESSLTSLTSVTEFWSGNQLDSAAEMSVQSVDQSILQHDASMPHVPCPVPSRVISLSDVSSSSSSHLVSDSRLASEQPYGLLPRQKTLEPSPDTCLRTNVSCIPGQELLPAASNSGWCISDDV